MKNISLVTWIALWGAFWGTISILLQILTFWRGRPRLQVSLEYKLPELTGSGLEAKIANPGTRSVSFEELLVRFRNYSLKDSVSKDRLECASNCEMEITLGEGQAKKIWLDNRFETPPGCLIDQLGVRVHTGKIWWTKKRSAEKALSKHPYLSTLVEEISPPDIRGEGWSVKIFLTADGYALDEEARREDQVTRKERTFRFRFWARIALRRVLKRLGAEDDKHKLDAEPDRSRTGKT